MARASYSPLFNRISGSIGGISVTNPEGGPVVYNRPHSRKLLSPRALEHIQVMRQVNALWATLTPAQVGYWNTIAQSGWSMWGNAPPTRYTARMAFTSWFSVYFHIYPVTTEPCPYVWNQPAVGGVLVNLWDETYGARVIGTAPLAVKPRCACWLSWPRGINATGAPGRTWHKIFPPVGKRGLWKGQYIDPDIFAEIGIPPEFRPYETGTYTQTVKPTIRAIGMMYDGPPTAPDVMEYTAPDGLYHVEVPPPAPVYA